MYKKRFFTSAPALSAIALGLVAIGTGAEMHMRDNNESLVAFVLSSDDGQEFDVQISSTLPDQIATALSDHIIATPTGAFDPDALEALEEYQQSDAGQQRIMRAWTGRILSSRNRFEEALHVLETLAPEERQQLGGAFAYAEALKGMGAIDEAIAAYQALIDDTPNHQAGHINFAMLLMQQGRLTEALPVLESAVGITNGRRKGKSLALLGALYLDRGAFDLAETALQQSIEYRPTHAPTWRRLAIARARNARATQDDTIATFQRALALSPGSAPTLGALAEYYFSVGRYDDALEPFRSASRQSQVPQEVLLMRAINLLASERPSAARNVLADLTSMQ